MSATSSRSDRINQHLLDDLAEKGLITWRNPSECKHWGEKKKYELSVDYYLAVFEKGVLESEDNQGANDWFIVFPPGEYGQKYSGIMFSPSLERFRHTTFAEFYNGGIVD